MCVCVVVGGLLSAHLLAARAGLELEPGWPCSGPLLRMAEDAARKLLPGKAARECVCVCVRRVFLLLVSTTMLRSQPGLVTPPAFQTSTGMPFGTVNLLKGVSPSETPVTCTAGVGTFILEFATLSRLTGDPTFEQVARRALRALWKTRSDIGLVAVPPVCLLVLGLRTSRPPAAAHVSLSRWETTSTCSLRSGWPRTPGSGPEWTPTLSTW